MIALAPPPAPGNRREAQRIAAQMIATATIEVTASRIANTLFATAVQEVRTNR